MASRIGITAMPAYPVIAIVGLASLMTAGLPTAYTLGTTRAIHQQAFTPDTPDLAPKPSPDQHSLSRSEDGFFYATADINGRRRRLLVDTGASAVMLSVQDARRLGVRTDKLVFNRRIMTSAGVIPMAPATLDRVTVAGRTFEDVSAMILSADTGTGLMGQSLLARFELMAITGDRLDLR